MRLNHFLLFDNGIWNEPVPLQTRKRTRSSRCESLFSSECFIYGYSRPNNEGAKTSWTCGRVQLGYHMATDSKPTSINVWPFIISSTTNKGKMGEECGERVQRRQLERKKRGKENRETIGTFSELLVHMTAVLDYSTPLVSNSGLHIHACTFLNNCSYIVQQVSSENTSVRNHVSICL